jgi:hypothetical protein
VLAGDPLLLAEHGDFHIISGQLAGDLQRGPERLVVNRLLPTHPYALFVFSDRAQRHWHFVNVKYDRDASKRRIFRRITVEPGERLRTATERLAMLDLETISRDLFGISPLAIQQRHDQAFDVEALTRQFFKEYRQVFEQIERHITALEGDARRLFTQKLFNRLMFIMFLERKGWLTFGDRDDYLQVLWKDYQRNKIHNDQANFYWDRLYHLFFSGLNNPQNLMQINTALPGEQADTIARFVAEQDATRLRNPEAVLQALRRVTVCDPACGSGAYLLGMLHELLDLRACLFTAKHIDARSVYERKLEIIQNNIYGVDIDPFAVNIAQLRLWLSLVVDFELGREGDKPPTLPNLDYKIKIDDSLTGPDPSGGLQLDMFRQQQIQEYFQLKDEFLKAHGNDKKKLRQQVEELQAQIAEWARGGKGSAGFDWAVEFAEVFDDGGFDIVVANPPYVRQELIKDLKPTLRQIYPDVYTGTADLYCYFYARAIQILRPSGMLVFISSNKWLRADYGKKLRSMLATKMQMEIVIDFSDLPVFGAIAYPVIVAAQKQQPDANSLLVLSPKNLDRIEDLRGAIDEEAISIPTASLGADSWSFGDASKSHFIQTMRAAGVPLGEYVKGQIYRGVLTGFNTAFIINGATRAVLIAQDPHSAEIIKPFLRGRDVKRWTINSPDLWLIFTRRGINIDLAQIIQVTGGQTIAIPAFALVAGDVDGDGRVTSSSDYRIIVDCVSGFTPAKNCADAAKKQAADITDDGNVNEFDLNLFLRELSVQG